MKIADTTKIAVIKGYDYNPNSEVYDDRDILIARGANGKIYMCFCYGDETARQTLRVAQPRQLERLKEMKII